MDNNLFSERLKEARLTAKLKQTELAKISGVTAATISAYECADGNKGKNPSLDNALKLAQALNVSLDWLCGTTVSNERLQFSDFLKMLVKLDETLGGGVSIDSFDFEKDDNIKRFPNAWNLVDIDYYSDMKSNSQYMYETFSYNFAVVAFGSAFIDNFLQEWCNMKSLYYKGTIDENLYNLWLNQQYKKIDELQRKEEKWSKNPISVKSDE